LAIACRFGKLTMSGEGHPLALSPSKGSSTEEWFDKLAMNDPFHYGRQ